MTTATAIGSYATAAALKDLIGTTDDDDDALLGLICDRINQYIESVVRQVLAPIDSATYAYDIHERNTRHLYLPIPARVTDDEPPDGSLLAGICGMRTVSVVQLASYTGGDYTTLDPGDYFLRQRFVDKGAFRWLVINDHPTGSYRYLKEGHETALVTGEAGLDAIPDDITDMALSVAQRAWNAKAIGSQDVQGTDAQGQPIVARFLSGRDRETLNRYRLRPAR